MIKKSISAAGVIFLLLGSIAAVGQTADDQAATYLLFDQIVGPSNTGIFDGVEYIEQHRILNDKHKFFGSYDFLTGTVFYDGQAYYNTKLKYNIFEDLVVVQLMSSRGENSFRLYDNKLDGFIINEKHFVNLENDPKDVSLGGIFELLFEEGEIRLLKKHRLKEKTLLDREFLHHEFEPAEPRYYFQKDGNYFRMNSNNLVDAFPEHKQEIRRFFRSNRKLLRNKPDEFMTKLFQMLPATAFNDSEE